MNNIGKPYAGKLHVRFDEGKQGFYPASYSMLSMYRFWRIGSNAYRYTARIRAPIFPLLGSNRAA